MTLVASWVRCVNKKKNTYELVLISDSRLNGGVYWDECPKIMKFGREDCVLGFAGDTEYSYPFMLQMNNYLAEYSKLTNGAITFNDLSGSFIRILNKMTEKIDDQRCGDESIKIEPYNNQYIFAGYDWCEQKFRIRTISYIPSKVLDSHYGTGMRIGDFVLSYGNTRQQYIYKNKEKKAEKVEKEFVPAGKLYFDNYRGHFGQLGVIGDKREEYLKILDRILDKRFGKNCESAHDKYFDMEPYEALCKLLQIEKENRTSTVGGAPQMVKVYQYRKSGVIGVYWPCYNPDKPYSNRTLLGRNLLEYEESDNWFYSNVDERSFPCHDGMNKYIDMFSNIRIQYTMKSSQDIEIQVLKGKEDYYKICDFHIYKNKKLTFNSPYKLELEFDKYSNTYHVYPSKTIKEYYTPPREIFEKGTYTVDYNLIDMFDGVYFRYSKINGSQNKYRVNAFCSAEIEYAKYCKFEIEQIELNPGDKFIVKLEYDKDGMVDLNSEPLRYSKEYIMPSCKVLDKEIYKHKQIGRLVTSLQYRKHKLDQSMD